MKFRVHAFEPASGANGPGVRAVVWFQGCTLGCPGCFNPATHDPLGGFEADTGRVAADILGLTGSVEGITVSGGEPFQQPEALLDLLRRLDRSGLGRVAFTGYALREIRQSRLGAEILASLDALIAGPFVASQPAGRGFLGSANQRLHLLTDRYGKADFADAPAGEVIVHPDGSVTVSGVRPPNLGGPAR